MDRITNIAGRVFNFARQSLVELVTITRANRVAIKISKKGGKDVADPVLLAKLDKLTAELEELNQRTTAWMLRELALNVPYNDGFKRLRWHPYETFDLIESMPEGLLEKDVEALMGRIDLLFGDEVV